MFKGKNMLDKMRAKEIKYVEDEEGKDQLDGTNMGL